MVDQETRLDSVKVHNDTFYYIYTLVNVSPGDFDSKSLTKILRPIVLKQSCKTPSLKSLVNSGATIAYTYKDKSAEEIATININKKDCR